MKRFEEDENLIYSIIPDNSQDDVNVAVISIQDKGEKIELNIPKTSIYKNQLGELGWLFIALSDEDYDIDSIYELLDGYEIEIPKCLPKSEMPDAPPKSEDKQDITHSKKINSLKKEIAEYFHFGVKKESSKDLDKVIDLAYQEGYKKCLKNYEEGYRKYLEKKAEDLLGGTELPASFNSKTKSSKKYSLDDIVDFLKKNL